MSFEWTGNILATNGAECVCGSLRATAQRLDMAAIGHYGNYHRLPTRVKRTWIVTLWDCDPMKIDATPLIEVVLLNRMPDEVRREAETLLRWAS